MALDRVAATDPLRVFDNDPTRAFLARWADHRAAELPELARRITVPLGHPNKRYLTRPVFLDAAHHRALDADLGSLLDLVLSLPQRFFGGDYAAMARAVGLAPAQIDAIVRTAPERPVSLGRADMLHDGERLRLVEFNVSSALGGWDIGEATRWLLTDPDLAAFVAEQRLTYTDPLAAIAKLIHEACEGLDCPSRPFVALVDWPSSFASYAPFLRLMASLLGQHGFDAAPCDTTMLTARDGHVYLDGRHVDVLYRFIQLGDLLEGPEALSAVEPMLVAHERGNAHLFTGFAYGVFASKGALALLCDDENRSRLDPAERDLVDRVLPWTRTMHDGETSVDGEDVDLVEYVLGNRPSLVLKPPLLHSGLGVVPGWKTDRPTWEAAVRTAVEGRFVVQRRVGPVAERFPVDDPTTEPGELVLNWGVFVVDHRYGGAFVRAVPDRDPGIISMDNGAGCAIAFHP